MGDRQRSVTELRHLSMTLNRQQLEQTIRDTLMRNWDPIAVRDNPDAQIEYDSYIMRIAEMLSATRSVRTG